MRQAILVGVMGWLALGTVATASAQPAVADERILAIPLNIKSEDMKWSKIFPELGVRSPEITILRVDPRTKATHLMIRVPKNFHVPMHWHTANETHTIMKGEFIIECDSKTTRLKRGDFNYVPAKMPHQAWTRKDGALLFITVDGAWDVNFVNGPPTRAEMLNQRYKAKKKEED